MQNSVLPTKKYFEFSVTTNPNAVWKKEEIGITQIIFCESNLHYDLFVKTLISRNFCKKNSGKYLVKSKSLVTSLVK